jgi:hypothetical protein
MKQVESKLILVCLVIYWVSLSPPLNAATYRLNPVQDAYVRYSIIDNPDTNYGNDVTLRVGRYVNDQDHYEYSFRSFLMFDLPSIPSTERITAATLYLYQYSGSDFANSAVSIYYLSNDTWNEGTITWANMPAYSTNDAHNLTTDYNTGTDLPKWQFFNLLERDRWSYENDLTDGYLSIVLTGSNTHRIYHSSEYADPSLRPYLLIETERKPYSIGAFDAQATEWYLDYNCNGKWDGHIHFTDWWLTGFGQPGDIPVTGDWDGDGITQIGVFRPGLGRWFRRGVYTPECAADNTCPNFGIAEDIAVTGDWNGDGKTEIGIYRPSIGWWFLDYNGNDTWDGCVIDRCFNFGIAEDAPVTGDWNGDGKTEIGVFRASIHMWFLDVNSDGTWSGCEADGCYRFGIAEDLPVTGDWNDDGFTEIGVYRPSTHAWYLDLNGDDTWSGCEADRCFDFEIPYHPVVLPVAGIW